jgi:preprotein translocase subunit SecD
VGFTVESIDSISATLGTTQLQSGLIAGLIGLLLVFVYSLFQYRLLGTVTIASLIVAGVITYFVVNIMSWREGYRLSLAGVAGLIVAIGFTADSFIVYFERIRDELRDGRGLVGAVEAGWKRALRTVLAAKSVNLLSAVILFVLAVGSVRGFALTLGVTTIIDVIIVILFTHPTLQLLATTRFFASGHPATGLDPTALGAVYRGRAEFRISKDARRAGASREAERRQTIAERKAAELAAANAGKSSSKPSTGKKEAR